MDVFLRYTLFFTLFTLLCARYFTKGWRSRRHKKLPPSPPALPIFGNLHQLGQLPHYTLWELSRKHGPLMLLHLGSKPMLVVSSAKMAKEVLKTHDRAFANKPFQRVLKRIFYDAKDLINLPYGEEWRKMRSVFMHELLNTSRVKSFNSIREEEISFLMEKLDQSSLSSSVVNLTEMFKALTNDMICRAAFGKKHSETRHGKEFLEIVDEVVGLLFNFTVGEFIPWLSWISRLNGYEAVIDKVVKKRDEIMDAIIADHLKIFSENKRRENFIDILLGIYKGKTPGVSMDLVALKGAILDIFGAGTDTSATALTWVMTELMRHPAAMKKVQTEIREIMKGKEHITDNDLQGMKYLKAVVKETLRLHPPIATYFREAREHVNLMGYDIAPETIVLINAWAIGQDPDHWHDPGKFMPERFLDSSVDYKGFDFQLVPFGAGRRMCPGLGFAVISIEHTVANLMHKFDWSMPGGAKGEDLDVAERQGLTIAKKSPLLVVPNKVRF